MWRRSRRVDQTADRPDQPGQLKSAGGRERQPERGIDAGEANRGAVAGKHVAGVKGGPITRGDRQVDEADRLARRGAARARDAGHCDREIDICAGERALGHGAGDLLADRADPLEQRRRYTQHLRFGAVVVGDVAALDDVGGAGDLGQAGDDQPAGAGLRS